ncbi:MAG: hypothetical protein BAJALOKI3v1_610009 [Promethearchaeota archaeon]|nr:MAG: hypothetical protein BAJALOKI3v1_610009 [Candidatus Lokiarchaeota archaeon]
MIVQFFYANFFFILFLSAPFIQIIIIVMFIHMKSSLKEIIANPFIIIKKTSKLIYIKLDLKIHFQKYTNRLNSDLR